LDFEGLLEILVVIAITIELYALYNHSKLDSRMDEHISNTNMRLERSDEVMKTLDNHMLRFDEHMIRLDEHMNKVNDYIDRLSEQMLRYSEHINKLDDLLLKTYNDSVKNE
jgi:hypothetical protein